MARGSRWGESARAAVSSGIATGVDVLLLIALVEVGSVFVSLAAFLAALAGGVTNFVLNKVWAFKDGSPWSVSQVGRYALVSLVNAALVAGAVHLFAVVAGLAYLLAKALAAVLVFVAWSYPAQAKFVFPRE